MHRALLGRAALAALGAPALLAACARPQPAAPGVQWAVIVLYNQPKDTAAFEKYYAEKHVPLFAAHAQEIGVTRAELITGMPRSSSACSASTRKITCSSEPAGMMRARTAAQPPRSSPAAERAGRAPPRRATSAS